MPHSPSALHGATCCSVAGKVVPNLKMSLHISVYLATSYKRGVIFPDRSGVLGGRNRIDLGIQMVLGTALSCSRTAGLSPAAYAGVRHAHMSDFNSVILFDGNHPVP
jgi:hypothetical protein